LRIRWQSFIDPHEHRDYFELLDAELRTCAGPEAQYEIVGIKPPDRELHRLTETRCAMRAIANAIDAERHGYDAFLLGHFQDSGLHEARSAVGIPVLGLGETSMLYGCTLGQRMGLVTIDEIFIPWHRQQVAVYGLSERVVGVTAMAALAVADYVKACADEQTFARVVDQFERAAQPLLERGAEVLIPAGGLPSLVLSRRPGLEVGGAAVLNPVAVLAKHGEAAVQLAQLGLPSASRKAAFARPSERCIEEFLDALA
jgi:Asp/Glu/hydantoin racemase